MRDLDIASLFAEIEVHFNQNLPFVVFNKPNANKLIGVFQDNNDLVEVEDFTEKGFVFVSFDGTRKVLIPFDQSQLLSADFEASAIANQVGDHDQDQLDEAKSNYVVLVQEAVNSIEKGDFDKVVLSRKEQLRLPQFDLIAVFQKLLQYNPTAFSYCFFHPEIGLWLGAFSEQLIRVEGHKLHTMAVAGTQVYEENKTILWGNKEQNEQQFVTDFIADSLRDYADNIKVSAPYSMRAGQVVHIKTDIEADLKYTSDLGKVIHVLHPTPAVCGFPKENAKRFIDQYEGYPREFYAGFLGELNHDFEHGEQSTDLFVNLRCMKVENNIINIYVGGGITKDSIPEKEWDETVNKSKTIKKILY